MSAEPHDSLIRRAGLKPLILHRQCRSSLLMLQKLWTFDESFSRLSSTKLGKYFLKAAALSSRVRFHHRCTFEIIVASMAQCLRRHNDSAYEHLRERTDATGGGGIRSCSFRPIGNSVGIKRSESGIGHVSL
jgi:hypothetical protein